MKHKFFLLWGWAVWFLTYWLPDMPVTMRIRGWLYSFGMKGCGRNFQVGGNVQLRGLENILVGNDVYFAPGVVVLAGEGVNIGDGVMLAFYVVVTDGNHTRINNSYRFGPRKQSSICINSGVWVGSHCTVLAGVTIGEGVVVGANSVVACDVPSNCLIAGVPGVLKKQLS